ncbi:unnamed protein product, partial [Bubo scandiacus]
YILKLCLLWYAMVMRKKKLEEGTNPRCSLDICILDKTQEVEKSSTPRNNSYKVLCKILRFFAKKQNAFSYRKGSQDYKYKSYLAVVSAQVLHFPITYFLSSLPDLIPLSQLKISFLYYSIKLTSNVFLFRCHQQAFCCFFVCFFGHLSAWTALLPGKSWKQKQVSPL